MKKNLGARSDSPEKLSGRYEVLLEKLSRIGPISQGSVMHAPPSAWRWTRKVKGKTVSVALSAEQANLMKKAIANDRQLDAIIDEMRQITQTLILQTGPGVRRRSKSDDPKPRLS